MNNINEGALSRRNLITAAGLAGASLALPGTALAGVAKLQSPNIDFDILNFALNLEYLEAEFYSYAVYGHGLDPSLFTGTNGSSSAAVTPGVTTGGKKVSFGDAKLASVAAEIAQDELNHVVFLRNGITAFGGNFIAKPTINLNALGIGFGSPTEFLTLARAFEDTGVSAYGGAATAITNKQVLQYAAQILATEAYHAGNIRLQLAKPNPGFATDSMDQPPTTTNFFPADASSLALIRTSQQVAAIARGNDGTKKGGFFPNGLNGTNPDFL